jgi:hypothetical protein
VVTVLFDDFCNADDPALWLGKSLRTEEEVALRKERGLRDRAGRGRSR